MNSHSAFFVLGISWCAALADPLHSSNLHGLSERSVRDAGFPGSGRLDGGRRCSPHEELEDQLVTATDRQLPRGANGCCRRFAEDYYDRRRDRWRRTRNDDEDRDDSHYSRKRRRFWRRLCRLFKRGGFRPHRAQDDDDEFAPAASGVGGFPSGFGGGFQLTGGGGFSSGPGFGQADPNPWAFASQVPVQKTSLQHSPANDDDADYPDGAAQGQEQTIRDARLMSGLRRGPSCALRDDDDYENTRGRFRILNKCCRKYGDVYYNYEEGDWVPRPDDEEDEGPASLRRFWQKMCEKYRTRALTPGAEATVNGGADTTVEPKVPVSNPSRQTTVAAPDDNSDEDDDTAGSSQGSGRSAATGNVDAKKGSVISIIQASHDSNPFLSVQRSLSASSGTGTDLKLDGAANHGSNPFLSFQISLGGTGTDLRTVADRLFVHEFLFGHG